MTNEWRLTKKSVDSILNTPILEQIPNFSLVNIEAEITEDFLGTVPSDPLIYSNYIAKKNAEKKYKIKKELEVYEGLEIDTQEVTKLDPDDIEKIIDEETKTLPDYSIGWTGFHSDEKGIFFYNYMFIGNIKANLKMLNDSDAISEIRAFKKASDTCLVIEPRRIRFYVTKKPTEFLDHYEKEDKIYRLVKPVAALERPLRASTPDGERITPVKSDAIKAGTRFKFSIKILKNKFGLTPETIVKCLKTGEIHGLGQWRGSGGYGTYKVVSIEQTKYSTIKKKSKEED